MDVHSMNMKRNAQKPKHIGWIGCTWRRLFVNFWGNMLINEAKIKLMKSTSPKTEWLCNWDRNYLGRWFYVDNALEEKVLPSGGHEWSVEGFHTVHWRDHSNRPISFALSVSQFKASRRPLWSAGSAKDSNQTRGQTEKNKSCERSLKETYEWLRQYLLR